MKRNIIAESLIIVVSLLMASSLPAATMLANWGMDEDSSPWSNSVDGGNPLSQDAGTTTANTGAGILGSSIQLHWEAVPGVSTRVASSSDAQTGNSFGFSLFVNPVFVSNGDMFISEEASAGSVTGRAFDYYNWGVRAVTVDDGLGFEFIVRGSGSEGFANQISDKFMANGGGQSGNWLQLAGGYDAATGDISLFVRDMTLDESATAYSGTGDSGMTTYGGGLALGTVEYNSSYVNFAANTWVDSVKLFDAPLTALEVEALGASASVPEPSSALLVIIGSVGLYFTRRRG